MFLPPETLLTFKASGGHATDTLGDWRGMLRSPAERLKKLLIGVGNGDLPEWIHAVVRYLGICEKVSYWSGVLEETSAVKGV